jgi:hypothetical protein
MIGCLRKKRHLRSFLPTLQLKLLSYYYSSLFFVYLLKRYSTKYKCCEKISKNTLDHNYTTTNINMPSFIFRV